jgi:hypothetical protein
VTQQQRRASWLAMLWKYRHLRGEVSDLARAIGGALDGEFTDDDHKELMDAFNKMLYRVRSR